MKFDLDDIWLEKMEGLTGLNRLQKRRLYRVSVVIAAGISYLIDTILLALFYAVGTVDSTVVSFYGYAALGHVLIFSGMHASGLSEKFKNPHLTVLQMSYSSAVQVVSIALAPKLTAFFLGIMFIIYAYGMLRISLRQALLIWLVASIAILVALVSSVEATAALWVPSRTEGTLVAISFSLILLRSIAIGYYTNALRMKLYEKSSHFEDAASHDALTGLFNRNVVLPAIKDQIALCRRSKNSASLAMLDVDNFKLVNDSYGHTIGDVVLARLSGYFESQVRESDMVGRFGGEEFIFLMPMTDIDGAMEIMERIREGAAGLSWTEVDGNHCITISCGVTEIAGTDTVDTALQRVDRALYAAKRAGKNRVHLFSATDAETAC